MTEEEKKTAGSTLQFPLGSSRLNVRRLKALWRKTICLLLFSWQPVGIVLQHILFLVVPHKQNKHELIHRYAAFWTCSLICSSYSRSEAPRRRRASPRGALSIVCGSHLSRGPSHWGLQKQLQHHPHMTLPHTVAVAAFIKNKKIKFTAMGDSTEFSPHPSIHHLYSHCLPRSQGSGSFFQQSLCERR